MNVLLVSWGLLFSSCFVFSVSGSHADSCDLVALNGGKYNCSDTGDGGKQCDISCNGVYQGRFYCYPGRGWDRPLPPCVKPMSASSETAADSCDLDVIGNGYYTCSGTGDGGKRCDIYCNGANQGRFYCYPGRGWDRPLPPCVKPRNQKVCGPNSKFSTCITCEKTCRNTGPQTLGCGQVCTVGCACDDGFIKDDFGNCIRPNQCSGIGTAAGNCDLVAINGGSYSCIDTADGGRQCDIYCKGVYQGKFKCYPGKGWTPPLPPCVRPKNQNVCGPNSQFSTCITCEPTCRNPRPQACAAVCIEGCACNVGFIKDDFGNCIPRNQCPVPTGGSSCRLVARDGYYDCTNDSNGIQCNIYCKGEYKGRYYCTRQGGWKPLPLPYCVTPE